MKHALVALLALVPLGCGQIAPSPVGRDDASSDSADVAHDAAVDASVDAAVDAAVDASVDVPPDVTPVRCEAGSACDGLLDGDGRCASRCVALHEGLSCHGTVRAGLCFDLAPPATQTLERGGWRREAVTLPQEATVGDAQTVVLSLRNVSDAPRMLRWQVEPASGWVIDAQAPASGSDHALDPDGEVRVTLQMHPTVATSVVPSQWIAARVAIDGVDGRGGWPIVIPANDAAGDVECGGRRFPAYRAGSEGNYGEAACCDGVFFPGAECCASAECAGGACVDGRCLRGQRVPWSASPLNGPQRVLIVLVDDANAPPADPCEDRSAALAEALGLPQIQAWYEHVAQARLGRSAVSWRFTVLAGLRSAELGLPNGSFTQEALHDRAEAWLRARGCLQGFDRDFDRTLVYSPHTDLGPYAGRVFRVHRIALNSLDTRLMAHEIGHTFGANDRYLNVGGELQWAGTLMSRSGDRLSDAVRDDVFWGEVGLGDADRDGVIDVHQTAVAPERLALTSVQVVLFPEAHVLRYRVRFGAESGGRALGGLPQEATLSFLGQSVQIHFDRWDALGAGEGVWEGYLNAPRDVPEAFLEQASRDGRVTLRIEARMSSTRPDFTRATLSLDETREVTLTPRGSALLPPAPVARPVRDGCGA